MVVLLSVFALLIGGCASDTFVITKHGKSYFFGSSREGFHQMLCESGDLQRIIADTRLSPEHKDSLYKYNCVEQSKDKVRELYGGFAPEQRRELRLAFQLHGYDINTMDC
ncbi:MAG: hypothetical protein AB1805_13370 [Nitrospirota bacterium]